MVRTTGHPTRGSARSARIAGVGDTSPKPSGRSGSGVAPTSQPGAGVGGGAGGTEFPGVAGFAGLDGTGGVGAGALTGGAGPAQATRTSVDATRSSGQRITSEWHGALHTARMVDALKEMA